MNTKDTQTKHSPIGGCYYAHPKIAILVDGGFYRKRAKYLFGENTAEERARELQAYCLEHTRNFNSELYRIFYYDCPPIDKQIYHPLLKRNINLKFTDTYKWTLAFMQTLKSFRKFALRLGVLSESGTTYTIKPKLLKPLCAGTKRIEDLKESDFEIPVEQKGVDMKIGIDIASLAYKKQVDRIVLISGDSDFVPAAKLARREGIDFILDPMWATIKDNLSEHIDGIQSNWKKKLNNKKIPANP